MPNERTKLLRLSQNTFTLLSARPTANKLPVSLRVTQFTWRFVFSKLIEPIDGSYFSLNRTYYRISE